MASRYKRLVAEGKWSGPNGYLQSKMKYAYQTKNRDAFVGAFEKGVLDESKGDTLFLGKPSTREGDGYYRPVVGRDLIRDSEGKLEILKDYKDIAIVEEVLREEETVDVVLSEEKLTANSLSYVKQEEIFLPETFEGYDIKLCGIGDIGLEIAIALMKMGCEKLDVYDSLLVKRSELAVSQYRCFDSRRPRVDAAYEIIADQTMKGIVRHGLIEEVGETHVVINTNREIAERRRIWKLAKKAGIFIDVQVEGEVGYLYCINPADAESVKLYEGELMEYSGAKIFGMTKVMAGLASWAIIRYLRTSGSMRSKCLDRRYRFSMDDMFMYGGNWGQTRV